jgi:putative endonuclease
MGRDHNYFVYLLASQRNGTLYCGVTGDLAGRIHTHREDIVDGFTRRYGVHLLVWYQWTDQIEGAILREKQIKKWRRAWKVNLIESANPDWEDLYPKLFEL